MLLSCERAARAFTSYFPARLHALNRDAGIEIALQELPHIHRMDIVAGLDIGNVGEAPAELVTKPESSLLC